MVKELILVASGGAIGVSLRHLWGMMFKALLGPTEVPLAIMAANILGSFLMGAFVSLAAHKGLAHFNPFIAIGLLGGFTTFSSFSLEAVRLVEAGQYGHVALYVALSVFVSIAALMAGLWAVREVLT